MGILFSFFGFLKTHKTQAFWLILGLGLGIWLAMLFRPAVAGGADTRREKVLRAEIGALLHSRAQKQARIDSLYHLVRLDSATIAALQQGVAKSNTVIRTKLVTIEKLKKEYEAVNRLDTVSDDELFRLFSDIKYPNPRPH